MDARRCARGIDPALEGLGPYQRGAAGRKGRGRRAWGPSIAPGADAGRRRSWRASHGGFTTKTTSCGNRALWRPKRSPRLAFRRRLPHRRRARASAVLWRLTTDRTVGSRALEGAGVTHVQRSSHEARPRPFSKSTAQPRLQIVRAAANGHDPASGGPMGARAAGAGRGGRDRHGNPPPTLTVHTRRVRCSSIPVRDDPVGRRNGDRARAPSPPPRARPPRKLLRCQHFSSCRGSLPRGS
jgi:hypothetical protein